MNKKYIMPICLIVLLVIINVSIFCYIFTNTSDERIDKNTSNIMSDTIIDDKQIETYKNDNNEIDIQTYTTYHDFEYTEYMAPENSGFKSFMDYRSITDEESQQYKLQHWYNTQTDKYGIRVIDNRYCVAIGSYFSSDIGQYFDIVLENGVVIPCILADIKADVHTDNNNIITKHNGCMSEFVVDENKLSDTVKLHGDMSYCNENWNSPVACIRIYDYRNLFKY